MENIKYFPDNIILLRYIKGEASKDEISLIDAWINEDKENENYILNLSKFYYASRTRGRIISRDSHVAFKKVKNKINKKQRKIYLKRIGIVAACLTGLILGSYYFASTILDKHVLNNTQLITIISNPGVRTHFILPDSTSVWLNSNSKFTYPLPFDKNERRVSISGEAFFNVNKKENQAFFVNTESDKIGVKVLGTEFNVQAYPDDEDIKVTLVNGKVHLHTKSKDNKTVAYSINPSEQAIYNIQKQSISLKTINPEIAIAWVDGKLIFKNTYLKDVFKQLEYFYNAAITVKDKSIYNYRFTGTFQNKQLSQILKYIELTSGVKCELRKIKYDDDKGEQKEEVIISKTSY